MFVMKTHQRVFGFTANPRATRGAGPSPARCVSDRRRTLPADPFYSRSRVLAAVRKRKGLKAGLPARDNFQDRRQAAFRGTGVQPVTDHSPEPPRSPHDTSCDCADAVMLRLTGFSGPLCAIVQREHLMPFLLIFISKLQTQQKCPCSTDLFGLGGRGSGDDTPNTFFPYLQRETQMSPQILE